MKFVYLPSVFYVVAVLVALTAVSCKKGTNPESDNARHGDAGFGNIAYFANASDLATKAAVATVKSDTATNMLDVNWSSATVYVEKITFTGKNGQLLDTTIMVEKNLNIFNTEALVGVIKLPAGSYKDIYVKMFCRKSMKSEFAFDFKGTFTNTEGKRDSVMVGSSYPFEANLKVTDIVINSFDNYKATFCFDLSKVLTGITNQDIQTARTYRETNNKKLYVIWKGGSADEPFYDQVIQNWQNVASIVVTKEGSDVAWER